MRLVREDCYMNRQGLVYVVAFTFVVTFVMSMLLSFAHSSTEPLVERNELERRKSTVLAAIGIATDGTEDIFAAYANLNRLDEGGPGLYVYNDEGEEVLARQFSGAGVWGEIVAVIAVNADLTRVIGVEILDQNETPGLGGRVTTREFLDQLRGESIGPNGITVVKRGPGDYNPENATIDGITGATGTTTAFDRMLNREIEALRELVASGRVAAGAGR